MDSRGKTDEELLNWLNKEPALRSRMIRLLDLVNNTSGEFTTADSVEFQLIEELQHLGSESLSSWAQATETSCSEGQEGRQGIKHGKKKSTGIRPME